MNPAISLAPDLNLMTSEECQEAVVGILAKGLLRLVESRPRETRQARNSTEGLEVEPYGLPRGRA
jgi:hypothetical protein